MQTFRVKFDPYSYDDLDTFISTLCEHGSPRIVSYELGPGDGSGAQTMVVEFTSYEDALRFAEYWFLDHWSGVSDKDPKEQVETDNDRLTRELNKERAAMMEEAAKIASTWDEGGCECDGYGCTCGNFDDAASSAAAATARSISRKLRTLADAFRAAGNSPEGKL